jgi:hypothetical protein
MELFGFQITKKQKEEKETKLLKVVVPDNEEGSVDIISVGPQGGYFVEIYDSNIISKDEFELIKKYRNLALCPEVDDAISEIVNEAITYEAGNPYPVKINLDNIDSISKKTKKKIISEFEFLLRLMRFHKRGYDIFREWYIDGRSHFALLIDSDNKKNGIKRIEHIDSLLIKKVRKIEKDNDGIVKKIENFYIYKPNNDSMNGNNINTGGYGSYYGASFSNAEHGLKFTESSIAFSSSGIFDVENKFIISYLDKALKTSNQLSMLEDAIVVYRVARAPERRIFYIDVGNLPKTKAEEYLNGIMSRYRNRVAYNTKTGSVDESKRYKAMLEDYWLPRREGGRGTEIDTLPGGENLGQLEDLEYFRNKLYKSLNVPVSRLESETMFNLGRDSEITRDEIKFSKFIARLRTKFSNIFIDMLKTQLILKNVVTENDWEEIEAFIDFVWVEDSYYTELKKLSVLKDRIEVVEQMDQMIERYYSLDWIRKNILQQTEEEAAELAKQRDSEKEEREETSAFDGIGMDQQQEFEAGQADQDREAQAKADAEQLKLQKQQDKENNQQQFNKEGKDENK